MAKLNISVIMPILQEEWQRRQARRSDHKSSHLARTGMHGGPQCQQWQGNQNNSGYTPQASPSNYNSSYKPTPYNKFGKKPNYKLNNQNPGYNSNNSGSKGPNGPNWERNHQNCQNKRQVKILLKEYSDSNNCPNVLYFLIVHSVASHSDQTEPKCWCM
jgi:hypothetical protein